MANKDDEFLKRLLVTFAVEAQEHVQGICSGLLRLEQNKDTAEARAELVETVFREAHSLKGAARAVNLIPVETLCQALETVFAALKKDELSLSVGVFDLLQEVLDYLGAVLLTAGAERTHKDKLQQRQLVSRLEGVLKGETQKEESSHRATGVAPPPVITDLPEVPVAEMTNVVPLLPETIRVATHRLISVLLQSEEMLGAKLSSAERLLHMRSTSAVMGSWRKEWTKLLPVVQQCRNSVNSVSPREHMSGTAEKQTTLGKLLDFLDWNSDFINSLETRFTAQLKTTEKDDRLLDGMVTSLLDDVKQVLMIPFSSLLEILPKIVRDLSRTYAKKIEVIITGEKIEIDRRILEEMKDPLVHLVRNCIDHGIESPDERSAKGKPPLGTITITVAPRDNMVELTVVDDGRGISLARVRSAVLKLGKLSEEMVTELSHQELLAQVFQSGITTSPILTEISGRGLGLAIVRQKVGKIGGTVNVVSSSDFGTTFRMLLPLTIATFRGILVRVGERQFVIPAMYVERALRLFPGEIRNVENRKTISLAGVPLSLASLAAVLELPAPLADKEISPQLQIVVLNSSEIRIAFQVDEVLGECEVLHKGLGPQLSRVRNVAGVTLLGNGHVAPILNVIDLLASAIKMSAVTTRPEGTVDTLSPAAEIRSILVAEDSITTRTLLKNILESAGYRVSTAVDGLDALTKLKCNRFDIVVSDVEMPRMNGFDLTARIRADKNLQDLPVILVTALASREDRERGIDVGADAYIVKGSFDQSNLLEVLHKLI